MGKKEQHERVETVLQILRKQAPLSVKQEKYCNYGCVQRFLKAKNDNVKKAAKQLRACLSWRESIGTENLIADEFSAELAEGVAYLSGHDEQSKPVLVFRIRQDYNKFRSQKLFVRFLVFTLEVAIGTMPKNTEQFVLLFDASTKNNYCGNLIRSIINGVTNYVGDPALSETFLQSICLGCFPFVAKRVLWGTGFFKSASAFMNLFMTTLKIVAEYYPQRLFKAFIIDPPSMFTYMWKGVRPFIELSAETVVVSSLDFEDPLEYNDFRSCPQAASLRFDPSSIRSTAKVGSCASSRFAFSVSQHFDSVKPWYLSLTDTSPSPIGPALISPVNARSFSFASPAARTLRGGGINGRDHSRLARKTFFPTTPLPERTTLSDIIKPPQPRTPHPSFFQSPATFFKSNKTEKPRESFVQFLKFYRQPYDEMTYRSKMRPPLGGLISIVRRRHYVSSSERF